jgi:hypothetical protein
MVTQLCLIVTSKVLGSLHAAALALGTVELIDRHLLVAPKARVDVTSAVWILLGAS